MQKNLTQGNILKVLISFSIPYLLACFLQTFYGLADLFIVGQYNGAAAITAVSIGSQVMHMLTVMIVGLSVGATISISRSIGARNTAKVSQFIGNTTILFFGVSLAITIIFLLLCDPILHWMQTPQEAFQDARNYLLICYAGIPLITAYNVIAGVLRGLGDSRSPMIFVGIAGVLNVLLDYIFIGTFGMSAAGAGAATVLAQAASVLISLWAIRKYRLVPPLTRRDFGVMRTRMQAILATGLPIMLQEGFIQISFLVITVIVNMRGVIDAAAVGIGEKIICFLFLLPSAMMSSVSAIAAQNAGADLHERAKKALFYGIAIAVGFGVVVFSAFQFCAPPVVAMFTDDTEVILKGSQYLYAYTADCALAAVHFCFSGFFSAYEKSIYAFFHNIISIFTIRIPGAYFASVMYPDTLFPLGCAAPLGSLLSALICIAIFMLLYKKWLPPKHAL